MNEQTSVAVSACHTTLQSDDTSERPGALEESSDVGVVAARLHRIEAGMFSLSDLDREQIHRIEQGVPGGALNVVDIYPLSPLQEGMLFHRLMRENADTYILSTLFSLRSESEIRALVTAAQQVIDRHDILRTAVLWEGLKRPVQVVCRQARLVVDTVELSRERELEAQLRAWISPARQMLDIGQAPVVRLEIARQPASDEWLAVLRVHHLLCDHQSLQLMITEIASYIESAHRSTSPAMSFKHYVVHALRAARSLDAEEFFKRKLAGLDECSAPFGVFDTHGGGSMDEASSDLESSLVTRVRLQARRTSISVARLFHAAWALVVARTSGREDVVFGTTLLSQFGREAQANGMLGMAVNTLPLRLDLRGITAKDLARRAHDEVGALLAHQDFPLTSVLRCSDVAPLFTALLNFRRNDPRAAHECAIGPGIRVLARGEAWTNYPITVVVDDFGKTIRVTAQVDPRIEAKRVVSYVSTALRSLVDALDCVPETPALDLSVLPENERHQLLITFNATKADYAKDALIHGLIEEQVARTPDLPAVMYEGSSFSYAQLNARANQLARHLRTRGIGRDQLVGICADRSLEIVVGLLGILKAGGAYVPIDPGYPRDRVAYMVNDAAPKVLLTQSHLRERLPETTSEVIAIDSDWTEIGRHSEGNLDPCELGLTSRNLAYVIYTSGSTGQPKGAMNEHRALINRLQWMQSAYQLNAADRVLQKTPCSFDVSVWEFFWPLTTGAQLVVARPRGHQDPEYLRDVIEACGVTTLHFVPSMLQAFLGSHPLGRCPSIRHVVCSGEELPGSLQQKFFDCLPQARLSNLYGPTEAAIDVTAWECRQADGASRVPLGRPISNTYIYVLDRRGEPVPLGVTGEIYIGGIQVGRGYLNRTELTAERFLSDPFRTVPQARMYKTGDLGRWRADGTLDYLGRNDHQVKIRGFRIELGEVEAALAKHPSVREAVVVASDNTPGDRHLVAYVVADAREIPTAEVLRAHLRQMLPEHMVPSFFVTMERMPVTANGKLDRRALPAPSLDKSRLREYEPPKSTFEESVARIWQELLRVECVDRNDNFFDLGGQSLLGIRMIAHVGSSMGLRIPIETVFQLPVLKDFAAELRKRCFISLQQKVADGDEETNCLIDAVASMSVEEVRELTNQLRMEGAL